MATLNFDASQVKPDEGRVGPVPAGWYNAIIEASEIKPTRDGLGNYLALTFKIIDGDFANRKVFNNLNIKNANPQTVEIAYAQLSAIAHAVKVMQVQDSAQLHNIPLKIKVSVRPASGDYEAANDIKAFKDISYVADGTSGATTGAQGGFSQSPVTPPPAQGGFPQQGGMPQQPWQQQQQAQQPMQQQPVQQAQQPWQQPQQQPAQQPMQQPQQQYAQQPVQQMQQQPMQQPMQQQPMQAQGDQYAQQAQQAQMATPPWQQ